MADVLRVEAVLEDGRLLSLARAPDKLGIAAASQVESSG
jgi:hypothetical protein